MTAISVFSPKFSVVLRKLVGRRDTASVRYQSAAREIDITSLLGDGGTIRTHKSIGEPCGGFTMTVTDRMGSSASDTLAALVEPMDLIEIRGAHQPHLYAGRTMPLIMRGFVSQVSRSSGMAPDGGPQRTVSIAGQELGRLWLVHSIFWQVAALTDIPYLDAYRAQVSIGMSATYQPVADFVTTLTEKVINQKINSLAAFADAKVKPFAVDATVRRGVVSPTRVAPFQGPIWGLAEQFVDRPWNEMWCEDRGEPGQEVPTVVLREAPFRDATTGKLLLSGAVVPEAFAVEAKQIVTLSLGRSDTRVANFFWVPPGAALLDQNTFVNVVALQRGDPLDLTHPNNLPDLYGLRRMEVATS
ncbi:MAG: hypothetical protein E7K72_25515, partial [Roseomonas mucosa]|nr:hypothetical protein [Roseomonas mucosa]